MSQLLIQRYLNDLDRLRKASGTTREGTLSLAFQDLIRDWGKQQKLQFLPQYELERQAGARRIVDGALVFEDMPAIAFGYWEAKDEADDLDAEIARKFQRGYPRGNIIFEDTRHAVLIQNGNEQMRCAVHDTAALETLLTLFFGYQPQEITNFRKAVERFKIDLPHVLEELRKRIDEAYSGNAVFAKAAKAFLAQAKKTINPAVTEADVREMLIQHILTEEIFTSVFNDADFHRQNNIAKELYELEAKFFNRQIKLATMQALAPYYTTISSTAKAVTGHLEKQKFLKLIYEQFYKVYNPKAADRLGVVYTPNEIVKFMIEGADWLCEKHFGKSLIDPHVEILDPATGTGTFICELLEHFRGQPAKLAHKYKNELHANEVAILPYYVANLNIEATYAAITGQFAEFPNLCFVDTLDNTAGLGIRAGYQHDMFGAMSDENVERIKRQNARKISVVIGNPPYNAWQENFNMRNPNRPYKRIDERIKQTYIKKGTAQNKNSVYDMYTRFFRWASDRLHDDGILALITNRNFIEKAAFDGFRRDVAEEFSEIYVVDLGGDVRANPKLSGTMHNVFGIQTGVTISFFIKRTLAKGKARPATKIHYARRPEMEIAEDKLAFLSANPATAITYAQIKPDAKNNWLGQTDNDWDTLIPVADKITKAAKSKSQERAIFRLFSRGLGTYRDDWVYDFDPGHLEKKMRFFVDSYEQTRKNPANAKRDAIKWDRELDKYLKLKVLKSFDRTNIRSAAFRPFVSTHVYFDKHFNGMTYQLPSMFLSDVENPSIAFLGIASSHELAVFGAHGIVDLGYLKQGNGGTQLVTRYRYTSTGERIDNITDWGLKQFREHYAVPVIPDAPQARAGIQGDDSASGGKKDSRSMRRIVGNDMSAPRPITKDAIFHYVYAVLHDPVYRSTYALNLKRDFPRVPFYPDFWAWAAWGEALMALHIGYEAVEPWPIKRIDVPDEKARAAGVKPKPILKSLKEDGTIRIDSETTLTGIPPVAFTYLLGNRSGLDWILDQYKEKTPKDPTIREKFNTYRFADYKEKVIDLIARVTRVSVETMAIVDAMKAAKR